MDLGIPDLTSEQIEKLCMIAEEAARKYVLSKVSKRNIEKLDICTEAVGTKPLRLEINVDMDASRGIENSNAQRLVNEAVKEGFRSAEKYLRELSCHSQK
ncbi:MAG: DUF3194 domain-containing protein [Candidatus Bathyarchaeia archaeon]